MEIISFRIKKFKSIEDITIPLKTYGKGKNKSSAAFLVGLNESGKSSILEAINLWSIGLANINYDDYYHKGSPDDDFVWIVAKLELQNFDLYKKNIVELLNIDADDISNLEFKELTNTTWQNPKNHNNFFSITINSDFPFFKYVYSKVNGIQSLKELNGIDEEITLTNAKSFLLDGQILLTKKEFEDQLRIKLYPLLKSELPKVKLWRPKPEYLINEAIDLEEFMIDTNISIPLRNIFYINGINTDEKIKSAIEKAISKPGHKAELQANLSKSITTYINKIWKELQINIKINIDASNCSVYVEDKDKEHKFFSMNQRSDGFNQFISLILSLSTENDNKKLLNDIILLDEPEIHLHPSGVRFMRDEILAIGKNNFLFVSTHSHYMIDTSTPERHYIVSKDQMVTKVNQIDESTSMNDDQVLSSAFGINLFKELLPQIILVVEGADDKIIVSHLLSLLFKDFFYSIKSAGGASKIYSIASVLADEEIKAYFILDDDKDGRDAKKDILTRLRPNHNKDHVLTIRDILSSVPEKSTLEDLLPIAFVKSFFEVEMKHDFVFDSALPVLVQIKNQDEGLKNNKELLTSKKTKLTEQFVAAYKTKEKLESDVPDLVNVIKELVKMIRQ